MAIVIVPNFYRSEYKFLIIGLLRDRVEMYARIDHRVEEMFAHGLLEEVRHLMAMGYQSGDPGMKGIGYREFFIMQRGCLSMRGTMQLIKRNSRRFAKRQMTFFQSIPNVFWSHPDSADVIESKIDCFLTRI